MKEQAYIIAEAGVNHNGSLEIAKKLVDVAADAGADAVKFQTFKATSLVSMQAPKADYQLNTTDKSESQLAMLQKLELDRNAHIELIEYCKQKDIQFLSTPFDVESLELLVEMIDLPVIKIPSGEITNAPFLLEIAKKGKKVILSTGMSMLGEIEAALGVLAYGFLRCTNKPSRDSFMQAYISYEGQQILKEKVILLHCTTEYPAPFNEVNLRVMDTLHSAFGLPVGYSDHTEGLTVPIGAVARGATVIEKHFTIDRNLPGPDHKASLEPNELKQMVKEIRLIEQALGLRVKIPTLAEQKNKAIARKSLVAKTDIASGELYTENNLTVKRPGTGISPLYYFEVIGKKAPKSFKKDEIVEC